MLYVQKFDINYTIFFILFVFISYQRKGLNFNEIREAS